jgi:hypothetical protein
MYDKIYRPCPICRASLSEPTKYNQNGHKWLVYECPNCGAELHICKFKKVLEGKL